MVEQYRHGVAAVTLELPGGSVEPTDESAAHAARRELLEETGYGSDDWQLIGSNEVNPAIQANRCFTYLAQDVSFIETPRFDNSGTELIRTRLIPLSHVPKLFREGAITHSLVMAAFLCFALSNAEFADELRIDR